MLQRCHGDLWFHDLILFPSPSPLLSPPFLLFFFILLWMYVCIYVFMYVRMDVWMYGFTHLRKYLRMFVRDMFAYLYVCTCTSIYTLLKGQALKGWARWWLYCVLHHAAAFQRSGIRIHHDLKPGIHTQRHTNTHIVNKLACTNKRTHMIVCTPVYSIKYALTWWFSIPPTPFRQCVCQEKFGRQNWDQSG